ncbi:catalase [Sedimenticola thiotaurini]|uniref:catalase n=1 Tax=Sedimenticola thiotaurini TaxID=1543721 RepID=UPI00069A8FEB|nr:catalase [Sedimenticola thiotaurini]
MNRIRKTNRDRFARAIPIVTLLLAGLAGAETPNTTEQLVAEMNQRIATISRASRENGIIPRFNQAKSLGCLNATFRVHDGLEDSLRQGLFATPASYPARLRFANASQQDDSEKDIRGLSIKLFHVPGQPVWGAPGIQDFLLNSYPALFVATPEDFLAFIRARQDGSMVSFFINPFDSHLKSLWILYQARAVHSSPFAIRFWSTTPFRLGNDDNRAVKYSVTPCSGNPPLAAQPSGPNQLRAAMQAQLALAPVCLEFGIQRRTDPANMPIEDASVIWDEERSPFLPVATITIQPQDFQSADALADCEKISFNPWQSLPEHQPLGRMNAVRRDTYLRAAQLRKAEAP